MGNKVCKRNVCKIIHQNSDINIWYKNDINYEMNVDTRMSGNSVKLKLIFRYKEKKNHPK